MSFNKMIGKLVARAETSNKIKWVSFKRKFHEDLLSLRNSGIDVKTFFNCDTLIYWPWWSIPLNVYELLDKWYENEFHPAVKAIASESQLTPTQRILLSLVDTNEAKDKTKLRRAWRKRPPICDVDSIQPDLYKNCPWKWREEEDEDDYEEEEMISEEEFNGPGYYEE